MVSGAVFFGKDTSEKSVTSYTMFHNPVNHITGLASVLVFAAEKTNFSPEEKSAKSLANTLDDFVQKVSTFPAFQNSYLIDQSVYFNGSLIQFEEAIRTADEDVTNLAAIAHSFRNLIPGYIQDRSLKKWILNLVVVDKPRGDSNQVRLKLARVTLSIATDSSHLTSIPNQNGRLVIAEFEVNGHALVNNAQSLSRTIPNVVSPRSAVDYFSSPNAIGFFQEEEEEEDTLEEESFPCDKRYNYLESRQREDQLVFDW